MYRCLLLLLVWAWPTLGCETGVAFEGKSLSLYRSSLANADVALLKSYRVADTNACLNDCCTEKYGSCSVASFKRDNATDADNCYLFNCRPVQKCIFLSSNSTDSFSFSSSTEPRVLVPSRQHASNISSSTSTVSTTLTPELDGPPTLKNDNTTVKPRKGVIENLKDIFGNEESSGVKPRKGVSLEGGGSKVKPRKGVEQQQIISSITLSEKNESTPLSSSKVYQDNRLADDLASALERVFEDDVRDRSLVTSSKPFLVDSFPKTSLMTVLPTSSSAYLRDVIPTGLTTQSSSSSVVDTSTSGLLLPSLTTTSQLVSTSPLSTIRTPYLRTDGPVRPSSVFEPTPSSPTILEHSRLIFHEESGESSDSIESERKYKSSMHLVLSLVFGLLILVSVLGVVAKRVYDSWMRRHYRRMDFLIDGMYNGYG